MFRLIILLPLGEVLRKMANCNAYFKLKFKTLYIFGLKLNVVLDGRKVIVIIIVTFFKNICNTDWTQRL